MSILNKTDIQKYLSNDELVITPLLQHRQLQENSIDLRLGNFFKIGKVIREPYIDIKKSDIIKFFDDTYRNFGESFILYPNQLVLATTFEYVKMPNNLVGNIITRSSINRLGLCVTSIVQPGYSGTLTLELINNTNTAIKLTVGMRIVQLILNSVTDIEIPYVIQSGSKYVGNTMPNISSIHKDNDLAILMEMYK